MVRSSRRKLRRMLADTARSHLDLRVETRSREIVWISAITMTEFQSLQIELEDLRQNMGAQLAKEVATKD